MVDLVKERPTLFSGDMVRALLAGTKTQTRRIAKLTAAGPEARLACPYGQPGDRLWVRETTYRRPLLNILTGEPTDAMGAAYAADDWPVLNEHGFDLAWWYRLESCPSIHMPRWASRILLEVTEVRLERLRDISEADAIAEGIKTQRHGVAEANWLPLAAREGYRSLWESLYGPSSWEANPWVWMIKFKRVTAAGAQEARNG